MFWIFKEASLFIYFVHYVYTSPGTRKYGFGNREMAVNSLITDIDIIRSLESDIALEHPAGTYVGVVSFTLLREEYR